MRDERQIEETRAAWSYTGDELFTIRQACAACGLSRSMVIKLEQVGFITPRKVDSHTGYRYYDLFDISQLQHYQSLRLMGLSMAEILDYYSGDDALREEIVAGMRVRLRVLTRGLEEMSVRLDRPEASRYSIIELPDHTCYCVTATVSKPADTERVSFGAHAETVRRGWRTMPGESIFTQRIGDDPLASPFDIRLCIPLDPDCLGKGPHDGVEIVRGTTALSTLRYGQYQQGRDVFAGTIAELLEEAKRRGLEQTGPVRNIAIVAPYSGVELPKRDYVFRLALPVNAQTR